jgi:cob(I)alamin adenosyltransferase
MRMVMRIYTKTGDGGETGLFGGARVPKNHERVEACGAVDEANAGIGLAIALIEDVEIGERLVHVQARLFEVGAILATPDPGRARKGPTRVDEQDVDVLERWIDEMEAHLPPLKTFILPGGTPSAAAIHHARTVVRRAERRVVTLLRRGEVHESVLRYLNRLSDFLFVAARLVNRRAGELEQPWIPRSTEP